MLHLVFKYQFQFFLLINLIKLTYTFFKHALHYKYFLLFYLNFLFMLIFINLFYVNK